MKTSQWRWVELLLTEGLVLSCSRKLEITEYVNANDHGAKWSLIAVAGGSETALICDDILKQEHIESESWGSVVYGVAVSNSNLRKARILLAQSERLKGETIHYSWKEDSEGLVMSLRGY